MPIHVRAHPEVRKPDRSTWTHDDWGNFIADRVAAKDWSGLSRAGLSVRSITVSAPTVLRDLLGPDQWYLSSHDGTPLPFTGLREAINNHRLRKYLSDRDAYRAQRKAPPKWYSNTMQFAARTADLQHMTIGQRAVAVRRIWDKGWHGGNRCKDKRLIPGSKPYHDSEACDLCGEPDSANHWHHRCLHGPSADIRTQVLAKFHDQVTSYSDTPFAALATALEHLLLTDSDPACIWTGNLNDHQLAPLLATLPLTLTDTEHNTASSLLTTLMTTLHDGAALLWF